MKTVLVAAATALAAAVATPTFAQSVEIEDAVARVVVIVEDRADVAVSVEAGSADLPALTVRREGDKTILSGGLAERRFAMRRSRIRECRSGPQGEPQPGTGASAEVRGVGRVQLSEAPLIIIRAPRNVKVSADGAVLSDLDVDAAHLDGRVVRAGKKRFARIRVSA